MDDKSNNTYTDLSLGYTLLEPDIIFFSEFVEEILSYYNNTYKDERIDVRFDNGTIFKYDNIPFDVLKISLYRDGWGLEKEYTSNYTYMEDEDGERLFWIDLYYSPEDYDSDKVFKDILREINNFKNRDLKEYLDNKDD